jgi:AcrR family transcriptional regulator
MREKREQKINHILESSLQILSIKGYENATIADISKAANVSRGILHYYFTDKVDLVSKVLASSSSRLLQSSLEGVKGKSADEIVDNIISTFRKNLRENPDFYAFLFEMWCASRRNKKIRKELNNCILKVVTAIEEALDNTAKDGMINVNSHGANKTAAAMLALSDGIAFQLLIDESRKLEDMKYWSVIKSMLLSVLKN